MGDAAPFPGFAAVSSSVNGIAAQAIAVSHALNTPAVHGQVGFNGASAGEVTQSVQRLVGHSGLWSDAEPNAVALLDPITGLAVRLVHVNVDGTLALLPAHVDSPAVASSADALPAALGVVPAPASPQAATAAAIPGKGATSPTKSLAQPLGRLFKAWVRALPATTIIAFGPNSKRGKCAQRYALYRSATTVGDYRMLST